ncbi:MAG: RecQ family zinc-binding domain-containing protein, partial [Blastocatellia bacterium]|nr:RecQ family zinc-binding domain-containing protein [Blastocatellia bacterium]
AHPLPVAVGDLATASRKPEIAVNAALQLLYAERWARITIEGKYQIEKPGIFQPRIEARTIYERRRRAEGRVRKMISYALDERCRRQQILGYFGQKFSPPCAACDHCASGTSA